MQQFNIIYLNYNIYSYFLSKYKFSLLEISF